MSDDDYGIYGKGAEGYAHYMQAFDESQKGPSGGGPKRSNNDGNNSSGCILSVVLVVIIYLIIKTITDG